MKIVDIFLQSYFKFSAAIESRRMRLSRVLTFLILLETSQIMLLLRLTFLFLPACFFILQNLFSLGL